jgi:hypothetical protein
MAYGNDTFVDEIVSASDPAYGIVDLLRAIERQDNVVEECGDLFGALVQQKTCGQEGEVNILLAEEVAESREVVVQ